MKHIKYWIRSGVLLCGCVGVVLAAYPTAYWQIGRDTVSQRMQFSYGDEASAIEYLSFFADGGIGISATTLSDGSGSGGQSLKLDVTGEVGADYYCDSNGLNCFQTDDLYNFPVIADNDAWPSSPSGGDQVFNQAGQVIQSYKYSSSSWEPTYTPAMEYVTDDFPLTLGESGDVVYNQDCNCLWCYDTNEWKSCDQMNIGASGAGFAFDCGTSPVANNSLIEGHPEETYILLPITSPIPGAVNISINQNGLVHAQTYVLDGTETTIGIQPIDYNGGGASGLRTFDILSAEGTGSCTGEVTVAAVGSFIFDCASSPTATGTLTVGNNGNATINIPITTATAGSVLIEAHQNNLTISEKIDFTGGETSLAITSIQYDGEGTAGTYPLVITSDEGTGSCTGLVTISP